MKTERRNKDTIVRENQTSGTINPNMEVKLRQELTQREETIVFLKEKLENQKQSIEDHARHLAHRSYQSAAMLADIEKRVYTRLYTRMTEDLSQKIKSLETLYPQKILRRNIEKILLEKIEAPMSNKTTYSRV
ncbi:hypothetical protein HHI36_002319 [Cryptolaemus montrouzieri]|uniref:Uncharacterized protein n=1 Tax=Cryptolaemus montrouzieri TaxID=559131 RepID=A0ABD2PAY9_9CUCU